MADAIILDGQLKSAVAAARSLARGGVRVICGATRSSAPALHSRACAVAFTYPDPLRDLEAFLAAVSARVSGGAVLFPFSDRTALALSRHRDRFPSGVRLLMPDASTVESVFDKAAFHAVARELGVPVAEHIVSDGAYPADAERFGFPVVVKPRFDCFWRENHGVSVSPIVASTADEARTAFARLRERTGEPPLVQRFVPGTEYGVTVVCRSGDIIALSAHRRLRSLASWGGASTAKVTIAVPPAFRDIAERVARRLAWTGPAMFEFKGNPDGSFVLLEMNGRFWGSLPLAVMAGTDFPLLALQSATEVSLTAHRAGMVGIFSRHVAGDAARILRSTGRARWAALGAFIRGFFPPYHDDLCSWSDPLPWFYDLFDSLKH